MSGDREAARHITRTWFEWEIDGLARKVILVVETDLAMQPDEQDYDALTLDMLRTEAIARSRASARRDRSHSHRARSLLVAMTQGWSIRHGRL